MPFTADDIAAQLDGVVEGDGSATVERMAGLAEAGEGDISFLANPRYAAAVERTGASVVLVDQEWKGRCACTVIRVKQPDLAFARVASMIGPRMPEPPVGVHPTAVVAADAVLGEGVSIGPHVVVESGAAIGDRTAVMAGAYVGHEVRLGRDCRLYPNVSLRERTVVGDRVTIHNGAVVGSDGFGNAATEEGWKKIPQLGIVEIGDDVEIGANTTIDRGRFGKTVLGRGVKVDNLVQIAHNVRIDEHTAMAAQVGVAGSTTIGKGVQLGGQAGISGHLHIGDGAIVGAQAGVTKDVPGKSMVSGYPAMEHGKARKMHAGLMRLPQLKQRVTELDARLEALEKRLDERSTP